MGLSCTDRELDAIADLSPQAWSVGIDQHGEPITDTVTDTVTDAFVADLTGMLDLADWQQTGLPKIMSTRAAESGV